MSENAIITIDEQEKTPLMELLKNPAIVRRFEMSCGRAAGQVMMNIINSANQNPQLWACEPQTVINAALNAAALNLSTAPALGLACILPFKKWKKDSRGAWVVESVRASFVPMKRGIRELAMRTNRYRVLNSFCVYKGQEWEPNQMTGIGRPVGPILDKKNVIGYGAYLLLTNGYEATEYMTRDEIMEHVKRFSPSWDKKANNGTGGITDGSKWATDFDMMAEGVVLKRLIRTKGVISEKDKAILDDIERAEENHFEPEPIEATEGHATDIPAQPEQPKPAENELLQSLGYDAPAPKPAPTGDMFAGFITPQEVIKLGYADNVPAAAAILNELKLAGKKMTPEAVEQIKKHVGK